MNPVEAMMQREIERLTAENTQLKKDYTRIQESATIWNERYQTKCQEYMDRQAALGAEIVALEAERDAVKEQMTADRKQFLDMRNERNALRADAMRYRWLRRVERGLRGWNVMHYAKCYTEETLDEVIDVAIGEKT